MVRGATLIKLDATPEEVARAIFAATKPPDPSRRTPADIATGTRDCTDRITVPDTVNKLPPVFSHSIPREQRREGIEREREVRGVTWV